ncbi:ABC transporter ATP-binding protein [Xylanibacillus composti]|nr:ABC transporter ATP-binding protein [Xylanibacillus composti]MDT9724203.1 ABC transporter ATP-binding protein [Xylanibacillus composti]
MQGVTYVYVTDREATLAVENIDLSVRPGEFVSLVGPSGCGKTTLLSLIAGLMRPTRGEVQVGGKTITDPSPRVGYMLQQDYLFPWKTILDNALTGLRLMGRLNPETRQYTKHLLHEMGLGHSEDWYPQQLSGGMRQRAALVRTLAAKPELLLLDEPFSALDYQTKLQLEDLVSETLKTHCKTAILVTHDISEAIAMSDRIIVLDRNPGRIRKEIAVPDPIRQAIPFQAREAPGFHELFNQIWNELLEISGEEAQHEQPAET